MSALAAQLPSIDGALDALRGASSRRLLLDYDGTLVPLAARPELAQPPAALMELLKALAACRGTQIHIVSGRPTRDLDRWLGGLPIHLHAEHGSWSRAPLGAWRLDPRLGLELEDDLVEVAVDVVAHTPGAFVEVKSTGLAFHYRLVPPFLVERFIRDIRAKVVPRLPPGLRWTTGSKVVELRPGIVHKGIVAARIASRAPAGALLLGAGDDRTDEDLFRGLPSDALTIKVGVGPSLAMFRVASHAQLVACLERLV